MRRASVLFVLVLGCGPAVPSVELVRLGLRMDAPVDSVVSEAVGGGATVEGPGLVVTVARAGEHPKTAEEAARDVEMFNVEAANAEALVDGFAYTFVTAGDVGRSYSVHVRRDIRGEAFWCESAGASEELQKAALAACKSLRRL